MTIERQWEIETKLIYSVIVAGKSATFADTKTAALLKYSKNIEMPFDMIRRLIKEGKLKEIIKNIKTGNYNKLEKALTEITSSNLNLETCQPEDLEKIHGIGPKTSRFFIIWIRPNERFAALDVHVLRWLNSIGIKAPKTTPNSKAYAKLEQLFIKEADRRGMTPRELDLQIWEAGARKNNIPTQEGSL